MTTVNTNSVIKVLNEFGYKIQNDTDSKITEYIDQLLKNKNTIPKTIIKRKGATLELQTNAKSVAIILDKDFSNNKKAKVILENNKIIIPANLPLGYHKLIIDNKDYFLICVPNKKELPNYLKENKQKLWGTMAQIYSTRSKKSWGIGDFEDLKIIVKKTAEAGGDFVAINPLHASTPGVPQLDSPYSPVSKIFLNPIYIRPEMIYEYNSLSKKKQKNIKRLFNASKIQNKKSNVLNRNLSWINKKEALKIIYKSVNIKNDAEYKKFIKSKDGIDNFAIWSLFSDLNIVIDTLPENKYKRLLSIYSNKLDFYKWLQFIATKQLKNVQDFCIENGMQIGLIQDLAVGVIEDSADVWGNKNEFTTDFNIGAPPDLFNQKGQNWMLPPLIPEQLVKTGYKIYKNTLKNAFATSGALRIDHALGLFRLWWIPKNQDPTQGVYVLYDYEAMFGILLLEAHRKNALIMGEILGTKENWYQSYSANRGLLNTLMLCEERKPGKKIIFKNPDEIEPLSMGSISNHDFPPTLGYLEAVHIYLRDKLGLSNFGLEYDLEKFNELKSALIDMLVKNNLLNKKDATDNVKIKNAMYSALFASDMKLIGILLTDITGEKRIQNQPGTYKEYPNWCIPLADSNQKCVLLENLYINNPFTV
jgi:4-alpha-glucanotransferase